MTDPLLHPAPLASSQRRRGRLIGTCAVVLIAGILIVAGVRISGMPVGTFVGTIGISDMVRAFGPIMAAKPTLLVAGELAVAGAVRFLERRPS